MANSRSSIRHVCLPGRGERATAQLLGRPRHGRGRHADTVLKEHRHHGRIANDRGPWSRQVVRGRGVRTGDSAAYGHRLPSMSDMAMLRQQSLQRQFAYLEITAIKAQREVLLRVIDLIT